MATSCRTTAFVLVMLTWTSFTHRCSAAQNQADRAAGNVSLHYRVSLTSPQTQRVAVTAVLDRFDPRKDKLRFVMQRRFAFVRLPEPLLEGPVRASANGEPLAVERLAPFEWEVSVGERRTIRLDYMVPLTHRRLESVKGRDEYEYPYVTNDHGLLVSPTLFVFPDDLSPKDLRVDFELPEGWKVIAPWRQIRQGEFDPGGRDALLNDVIAVGAWHVHEIRCGRFEGTIAFAPGQDPLEEAAVEPIRRIVEYQLSLFGREAAGRYLFVFGRAEGAGMGGSPKTRSMTLYVAPRLVSQVPRRLPHLIAHEFFHTWTSGVEIPDELRWVNEGFTDYYAYLVPARLALNSWEDFANTLAEKMQNCAANPQRGELSLSEAGGELFFRNQNAYDLVYDGGLLIGAWLDRAIRCQGRGKTLDDLMRAFNNDPRWTAGEVAPTLDDFLAVARQFTDGATAERLGLLATQPYDFNPLAAFAEVGIAIRRQITPAKLNLRANLDGTRVIDMDQSGVAYRIGIRENDRLIEVNGQTVSRPGAVYAAWQKPIDARIRVRLERNGEVIKIDQQVPNVEKFIVPVEPWRERR